jgi:GntR family transcriptional regulator, rspAB operon transcriptional repressor
MDAPVPHRDRARLAAHFVFDQLREMILSLALPPGSALSRVKLQRQFGASSTPIRDALMRLEEMGLVNVFPQSGTIVSLIDVTSARQAQFLRQAVEQEAVRRLAAATPPGLLPQLQAAIAEQQKLAKKNDLKGFNEADFAFHKILYEAAGVSHLWDLVRRQSGHIDRIRRLHLPIGGKTAQIIRDHNEILKAIADGKPTRAETVLRRHLSQSLAFSKELRLRFPHYFNE